MWQTHTVNYCNTEHLGWPCGRARYDSRGAIQIQAYWKTHTDKILVWRNTSGHNNLLLIWNACDGVRNCSCYDGERSAVDAHRKIFCSLQALAVGGSDRKVEVAKCRRSTAE